MALFLGLKFQLHEESTSLSGGSDGGWNRSRNNKNNWCLEGNLGLLLPGIVMVAFVVRIMWFFLLVFSGAKTSEKTNPGNFFYLRYFSVSYIAKIDFYKTDWFIRLLIQNNWYSFWEELPNNPIDWTARSVYAGYTLQYDSAGGNIAEYIWWQLKLWHLITAHIKHNLHQHLSSWDMSVHFWVR